jgi:hypothetical protein
MNAQQVCNILKGYRFNYANEQDLQEGIKRAFTAEGLEFGEEVSLSKRDRIDFMVDRVGVEVKVGHPLSAVMRQIHRYSQDEQIDELLVVTNRCRHSIIPEIVNGKPVVVLFLGWGML